MIRYLRGTLETAAVAGTAVTIVTESGTLRAEVPVDVGPAGAGDLVVAATATVRVGIQDVDLAVLLGTGSASPADPAGPLGLAGRPVVVLPDLVWTDLAMAGVHRAGQHPDGRVLAAAVPAIGLAMLQAAGTGAGALLLAGAGAAHLRLVRVLGGRPVAALPLPDPVAVSALLDTGVDVIVAVPTPDDETRMHVRALLAPLGLEVAHQLVEVDPAPAFEEKGEPLLDAPLAALAAGAAGVLAGRLAAAGRRWRADLGE